MRPHLVAKGGPALLRLPLFLPSLHLHARMLGPGAALVREEGTRPALTHQRARYAPLPSSSLQKFEAEVYALTKEEGGRHTPFTGNYKPQFFFRTADVVGESRGGGSRRGAVQERRREEGALALHCWSKTKGYRECGPHGGTCCSKSELGSSWIGGKDEHAEPPNCLQFMPVSVPFTGTARRPLAAARGHADGDAGRQLPHHH